MSGHVTPNTILDAFRGFEDDTAGAIPAQAAIAAVDTNWTQAADAKFHVAFLITETAGASEAVTPRVEYNINGGAWNDVTALTPIKAVLPDNCTTTDLASYGTTALTTGATGLAATEYDTAGDDFANVALNSTSREITGCFTIDSAQVSNSDVINLRVTNAGTSFSGGDGTVDGRKSPRIRERQPVERRIDRPVDGHRGEQGGRTRVDRPIHRHQGGRTFEAQRGQISVHCHGGIQHVCRDFDHEFDTHPG